MYQSHSESLANASDAAENIKAIENDREFKAHIYQQLVELQPFLSADSQVAVLVQQDEEEGEREYELTLVATLGEYRLEADGRASDIYEAFGNAKRKMLSQLDEYVSLAVDSKERDAEIRSFAAGGMTIH